MRRGKYFSDFTVSITPVLGATTGGEIMKNSPKYAAWWAISRLNTMSESRRSKVKEQQITRSVVSEHVDADGRLPVEKNCRDLGKQLGALGVVQACYSYTDQFGKQLFQVLRLEPKSFRQRHWSQTENKWIWQNDTRNVLFRLPLVKAAIREGADIWITEGEEDAIALLARGIVATTVPGGASEQGRKPKWLDEHSALLDGAKMVYIWADDDGPGIAHATSIALSIRHQMLREPQVVVSDRGKDAREHFELGGTMDDLLVLYGSCDELGRYNYEEELDDIVSRFLYNRPEFVPREEFIRARLRSLRDPCDWEAELETLS